MRIGLFAVDDGPRSVIQKLSKIEGFEDIKNTLLSEHKYDGIVIGTSGSKAGVSLESEVRINAKLNNIPLIIIEDYPGNYIQMNDGASTLLIVEHEFCYKRYLEKYGINCPSISIIPNLRYDNLRISGAKVNSKLINDWENNKKPQSVLWAGQPETEDALVTLNQIMPIIKSYGIKLLFKSHPRDKGYENGKYNKIRQYLNGLWEDVSSLDLSQCVNKHAPRIVITHYSSLGIEAGFYGVPCINVLFDNAGGKTLQLQKGYRELPWSLEGGAILTENVSEFQKFFPEILFDNGLRQTVLSNFMSWFSQKQSSEKVVSKIKQYIQKNNG